MSDTSHRDILRATGIIGGSQVVVILLNIVRTKLFAVLLGPAGIGILGMFSSLTGLVGTLTGLGIRNSGVRQIAEAAGTGDAEQIRRTTTTLRRVSLFTGLAGAVLFALLAFPLAQLSFGNTDHGWELVLLSLALLFGAVSVGQTALIQGLRRIGDLGRLSILGALAGTVFGVPFVYLWGTAGIAASLVAVAATGLVASWFYARRLQIASVQMAWHETWAEAKPLVRLGVVFMSTGLMTTATIYLLRLLVSRQLGVEALGLYQSAANLAAVYVGMIIGAMVTDFYPRLTAAIRDDVTYRRLVNEQAEVGLLVAAPGVLATMMFAPVVISIFYSAEFSGAVPVLEWQAMGLLFRVISWPLGYILLAKADTRAYFWTELAINGISILLIWWGISLFGLVGTGMAFFATYVLYWAGVSALVHRRHQFSWSMGNRRLWLVVMPVIAAGFLTIQLLPRTPGMALAAILVAALTVFSVRRLNRALGVSVLSLVWRKVRRGLRRGNHSSPH